MMRRPPRSTQGVSSAASDVYKRQGLQSLHFSRSNGVGIACVEALNVLIIAGDELFIGDDVCRREKACGRYDGAMSEFHGARGYAYAKAGARPLATEIVEMTGSGGQGWIRTSVRLRGQIYSLLPLTTRPPVHTFLRVKNEGTRAHSDCREAPLWRSGACLSMVWLAGEHQTRTFWRKTMAKGERKRALRGRAGRMKGGRGSGRATAGHARLWGCLLYTSPSPRDQRGSRMPSSA